jgi:hypothetical protein
MLASPSQTREGRRSQICSQEFRTKSSSSKVISTPQRHNTFPNPRVSSQIITPLGSVLQIGSANFAFQHSCAKTYRVPVTSIQLRARAHFRCRHRTRTYIARPRTAFVGHLPLKFASESSSRERLSAVQAVVTNDVWRSMAVSTCSPYKRGQSVPSGLLHDHVQRPRVVSVSFFRTVGRWSASYAAAQSIPFWPGYGHRSVTFAADQHAHPVITSTPSTSATASTLISFPKLPSTHS